VFAVSLGFLYLAIKDIDLEKFLFYFKFKNLDILFYVFFINIILRLIITLRWSKLLYIFQKNDYITTFYYTNIGYFANNVLPARLGDILKSYLLAKKKGYKIIQVMTSVVVERVFDLIGLFFIFIFAFLSYDLPNNIVNGGFYFFGSIMIISLITLLIIRKKDFIDFRLERISNNRIINLLKNKIDSVFIYLQNFINFKDFIYLILNTILIWFFYVFTGYLIIERLSGYQSWDASILSILLTGISFILPSAPGNIGIHQFACVVAFGILGLDKTLAVAFSFYFQVPVIFLSIFLGLFSIYYEGFSLKYIYIASQEAKSESLNENN